MSAPYFLRWIGDDMESVVFDANLGSLVARIWHDGFGKYHPTVYLPVKVAIPHFRSIGVVSFSFRSFPRISLELLRLTCVSMSEAQDELEDILSDIDISRF